MRGFTIIELILSIAILLAVVAASSQFLTTTGGALAGGITRSHLASKTNALAERIADELMRAGASTITDPAGGPAIEYRRTMGHSGGAAQWGSPLRIEYRPADDQVVWIRNPGLASEQEVGWATGIRPYLEGETDNGSDDNGNGLVDERGVSFDLDGDVLTIRISMQARDPDGRDIVHTATSSVRLRN